MIDRPYESADLPGVIDTYTTAIQTLAASHYSPEQIAAWAPVPPDPIRWRERLSRLHTIVADADGALAGFVSYTGDGYIDFLFTHPAFARRGVATRLYRHAEAALCAARVPRLTTFASLASRQFFERHGFQVEREEDTDCRGVLLRRYAMQKPLPNSIHA